MSLKCCECCFIIYLTHCPCTWPPVCDVMCVCLVIVCRCVWLVTVLEGFWDLMLFAAATSQCQSLKTAAGVAALSVCRWTHTFAHTQGLIIHTVINCEHTLHNISHLGMRAGWVALAVCCHHMSKRCCFSTLNLNPVFLAFLRQANLGNCILSVFLSHFSNFFFWTMQFDAGQIINDHKYPVFHHMIPVKLITDALPPQDNDLLSPGIIINSTHCSGSGSGLSLEGSRHLSRSNIDIPRSSGPDDPKKQLPRKRSDSSTYELDTIKQHQAFLTRWATVLLFFLTQFVYHSSQHVCFI